MDESVECVESGGLDGFDEGILGKSNEGALYSLYMYVLWHF